MQQTRLPERERRALQKDEEPLNSLSLSDKLGSLDTFDYGEDILPVRRFRMSAL